MMVPLRCARSVSFSSVLLPSDGIFVELRSVSQRIQVSQTLETPSSRW